MITNGISGPSTKAVTHKEKSVLENELDFVKSQYGEFIYDIPLPEGIWTNGALNIPHTRLKRILQVVSDLSKKPLNKIRVLDLGSLDGQFSLEFAYHQSDVVGVEVRHANVMKSEFCKRTLELRNITFLEEDARNISLEQHGRFDVIICSGLLYHLTATDSIELIKKMYQMTENLLVLDTHISLQPQLEFPYEGSSYFGNLHKEHGEDESQDIKETRILASWDNPHSFWFTRPSLVNILNKTGFTSVYEAFTPAHKNYGNDGFEHEDRCTFVAVKGNEQHLFTSPSANDTNEFFDESQLQYKIK